MDYPEECPECHLKTIPNVGHFKSENSIIYVTLFCPNHKCRKGYVAEYEKNKISQSFTYFQFNKILKGQPKKTNHSRYIEKISPNFIKIYNEAYVAEQTNLLEICSVGYRKVLEFLIKDYIKNPNVLETAKRAIWLSNDEAHYVRVWEDKGLSDLKNIISLTISWIELELKTKEINISMQEKYTEKTNKG